MSVTCAECCRHIFSITTRAERISRSTRIVRTLGPYSHLCRHRYRLPGGRRPASSLRASRSLSCHLDDDGARSGVKAGFDLRLILSMQSREQPLHALQVLTLQTS